MFFEGVRGEPSSVKEGELQSQASHLLPRGEESECSRRCRSDLHREHQFEGEIRLMTLTPAFDSFVLFIPQIEKENLMKELNDKQDLLLDSLKALDLLEAQKSNELQHSGMMIDELNSRIEALQHELSSLQNARHDTNKSVSRNDTGYADFLGAVDSKDVEYQRKLKELTNIEASFKQKMTEMNQTIQVLHNQKKELEAQASDLLYENNEMKDKMAQVERVMSEQVKS